MERNSLCQLNFLVKERESRNLKNTMLTESARLMRGIDQNGEVLRNCTGSVCDALTRASSDEIFKPIVWLACIHTHKLLCFFKLWSDWL